MAEEKKKGSGWLNVAVDYGPLLVFLGTYRYFAPDDLPKMWRAEDVEDALREDRPLPEVVDTDPRELSRIKRRLQIRWVMNLLHGRPEPRHPCKAPCSEFCLPR